MIISITDTNILLRIFPLFNGDVLSLCPSLLLSHPNYEIRITSVVVEGELQRKTSEYIRFDKNPNTYTPTSGFVYKFGVDYCQRATAFFRKVSTTDISYRHIDKFRVVKGLCLNQGKEFLKTHKKFKNTKKKNLSQEDCELIYLAKIEGANGYICSGDMLMNEVGSHLEYCKLISCKDLLQLMVKQGHISQKDIENLDRFVWKNFGEKL